VIPGFFAFKMKCDARPGEDIRQKGTEASCPESPFHQFHHVTVTEVTGARPCADLGSIRYLDVQLSGEKRCEYYKVD